MFKFQSVVGTKTYQVSDLTVNSDVLPTAVLYDTGHPYCVLILVC